MHAAIVRPVPTCNGERPTDFVKNTTEAVMNRPRPIDEGNDAMVSARAGPGSGRSDRSREESVGTSKS
jgi:hypothetical protein